MNKRSSASSTRSSTPSSTTQAPRPVGQPRADGKAVGRRISGRRRRAGLSQERLAEGAGCSLTHLGQVERGVRRPSVELVKRIAAVLAVEPAEILFPNGGDDDDDLSSWSPILRRLTPEEGEALFRFLLLVTSLR